jgi:protein-tyrosine phosphatase
MPKRLVKILHDVKTNRHYMVDEAGRTVQIKFLEPPSGEHPMTISKICDGLYQTSRPTCRLPGEIKAVVNLEQEIDEKHIFPAIHAYLWLPLPDTPTARPTAAWLDAVATLMMFWTQENWPILVHCTAGISRSTLVTAAYLMKSKKLGYMQAVELVKLARPEACPNSGFLKSLEEYEAYLRDHQ